MSVKIKYTEE
jgi:hypothetical protein